MSVETRPEQSDAPIHTIAGSATEIDHPYGLALDAVGNLYVLGSDAINVFARGADGDAAPIRSIGLGSKIQPRALALDRQGRLYVASVSSLGHADSIEVLEAIGAGPLLGRAISGPRTRLKHPTSLIVDRRGYLYVGNYMDRAILVFAPKTTGNVAPHRVIRGDRTQLTFVSGIGVDAAGHVYALNDNSLTRKDSTVTIYAPNASGNAAPIRTICAAELDRRSSGGLAVACDGTLYVCTARSIAVYAPGASGRATPRRVIAGESTGLALPHAVAIDAMGNIYVDNWGNFFARVDIDGESLRDKPSSVTVYAAQ